MIAIVILYIWVTLTNMC